MQAKVNFFEAICELNFLEVIENVLISLSEGRKLKFVKKANKHSIDSPEPNTLLTKEQEELNNSKMILEINAVEAIFCCLTVVPSIVKTYVISKGQKTKEYPLLNEFSNLLLYQDNFGTKYEVKYFLIR